MTLPEIRERDSATGEEIRIKWDPDSCGYSTIYGDRTWILDRRESVGQLGATWVRGKPGVAIEFPIPKSMDTVTFLTVASEAMIRLCETMSAVEALADQLMGHCRDRLPTPDATTPRSVTITGRQSRPMDLTAAFPLLLTALATLDIPDTQ